MSHLCLYKQETSEALMSKAEIARIAAQRAELSGEYFHIVGAKAFLDGVTEAHTGWQNQDYLDQPGYHGVERTAPKDMLGGICQPRNVKEVITREQSLRAMTINVARQWHQEHRMGSTEFGKIANMAVFDCDFLHDDIEKVAQANIVATIVDGEEVYKA